MEPACPAVKLSYAWRAAKLSGSIAQRDVDEAFTAYVPVEVQTGSKSQVYWLAYRQRPRGVFDSPEITAHQSGPARRRLPDDNFEMRPHNRPMPVASKRRVEARKAAPIVAVEPEPQPQEIDLPPAIKVTALVFSYDSAPALRRCLAALEGSNDRASIEILVVDCGSHDESAQLDSEFSNVTMLRLPRYFGRTKALNIGTRTAAGEYLLFMTPEVEVLAHHHSVAGRASGVGPGNRRGLPAPGGHPNPAGPAVLPPSDARHRPGSDARQRGQDRRGFPRRVRHFSSLPGAEVFRQRPELSG